MDILKFWFTNPVAQKITVSLLALGIIFIVRHLTTLSANRYVKDSETKLRIRKWIKRISYMISLLVLTSIFSDKLGSLPIFLGAFGVGIAFALQEIITSFAGWIAIAIGKFYRAGDRVELGGIKGDVIDISVLRTTLMEIREWVDSDLNTGRIVRIANSFVFKEPVFNYTSDFPFLWDEIKVPIRHGSDHALVRELLQNIATEVTGLTIIEAGDSWNEVKRSYFIDEVMLGPQTTINITDNWLEFTIRYIVPYNKRRYTKDLLFTRILDDISEYPGKIAIASTTIAIVEMPPFETSSNSSKS
ncbi:MAG: mechanosensitive ion channel domain-containing protein [Proteocatella sp.]